MTRKSGLTLNQHISLGLELARMRDRLTLLTVMIGNSYPKSVKAERYAARAVDQLDRLRSQLDGRLSTEPDDFDTHIYYPDIEQRTERTNIT